MTTGILNGNLTFTRYRCPDPLPADFNTFLNANLRKFAFQPITIASEEMSMGWTSIDNEIDTQFQFANYALGEYVVFGLRIDRKNVPASLLKVKVREAEKAFLEERKQERLFKDQRKHIQERVRLELLKNTLPVPAFFDACWSPTGKWLVFSSHTEKVNEQFAKLFERSFQLKLFPFVPWDKKYLDPKHVEAIEKANLDPCILGRDFLTWLWFTSENNGCTVSIDDRPVEIIFLRKIVFECGNGEYTETVSCQGLHSEMEEGKTALRGGKKIKNANIRLGLENSECEFTLKADGFKIQSLKIPKPAAQEGEKDDKDARALERIYHLEKVMSTMDRLFLMFLESRFSDEWPQEQARMREWIY